MSSVLFREERERRLQRGHRAVRGSGEAGVIDPAKVTRTALQNAASIAGLMLTTEAMVSELPDDDKGSPAMPGGMGGMSGMGM